jgi:hypothetical protein
MAATTVPSASSGEPVVNAASPTTRWTSIEASGSARRAAS